MREKFLKFGCKLLIISLMITSFGCVNQSDRTAYEEILQLKEQMPRYHKWMESNEQWLKFTKSIDVASIKKPSEMDTLEYYKVSVWQPSGLPFLLFDLKKENFKITLTSKVFEQGGYNVIPGKKDSMVSKEVLLNKYQFFSIRSNFDQWTNTDFANTQYEITPVFNEFIVKVEVNQQYRKQRPKYWTVTKTSKELSPEQVEFVKSIFQKSKMGLANDNRNVLEEKLFKIRSK